MRSVLLSMLLLVIVAADSFAQTAANPQNRVELDRLEDRGRRNRIWGGAALAAGGTAVLLLGKSCVTWGEPPSGTVYRTDPLCEEYKVTGKMTAIGGAILASGVSLMLWEGFKVSASSREMRLTLAW